MKYFDWDKEKNQRLKTERDICFEDIIGILEDKQFLDLVDHPNRNKYPNQQMFVIVWNEYVYLIPFVEDKEKYFLKTIIPSRKATKQYLEKKK
jgi:uncharacterized DUF497 family protein